MNTVDLANTSINWITRSDRFYSMEISKLAYEMASPDYINFFYGLEPITKAQLLQKQFSLYKGINHQLIDAIYNRLYELFTEDQCYKVHIRTQSKLTEINVGVNGDLILNFYHSGLNESFIEGIKNLMLKHKRKIREHTKFYSQDLINNLFRHPYTKIDFVMEESGVSRKTAAKYLDELDRLGIVSKQKIWKDNYYINTDLFNLLQNVSKL